MERSVDEVAAAIMESWSRETAYASEAFLAAGRCGDRSRGQCGTTALVIEDWLAGELVVANVVRENEVIGVHYWNRLPTGREIDLTKGQLVAGERLEGVHVMARPLGPPVHGIEPYLLLSRRVRALLGSKTTTPRDWKRRP